MKKSGYTEMYDKVYALLADTTPLKADCGLICSRRCCSGAQDKGMLLFPGEKTALDIKENSGRRLAVCNGECDRRSRPLSCMIFPFFPVIDSRGKVKVDFDFRGISVCPLISNSDVVSFNGKFFKNLLKAGKILAKDNDCRRFMKEITEEIDEAKSLYTKLKD